VSTSDQIQIPEFGGAAHIFGAPSSAYVDRDKAYELEKKFGKEAEVATSLFHRGGKLTQYGLRLKPEVDSGKAHRALQALLCSFEPSHEAKIATVAQYLHQWCDPCKPEADADTPRPTAKKAVARASRKWRKKK
jgi:hypothetical protein